MLTLMGIGGLSIGANASLIQQTVRRTGLHADLLSRIFELRNMGKLGPEDKLSPADLDLSTTEEQFALVAVASFLNCLDSLDLSAFAETMFENALLFRSMSDSVSGERDFEELWNAFRAMQGLAVLDVLSAFDINVLCEMQATMAATRYPSTVLAQMALTVQRAVQPHTHRPLGLEPDTVERAATLVGFAGGLMGKVYNGLLVTPSELAAAVIVARVLGAVSEGGAVPAGRVLLDEVLRMAAAGPLDMALAQPLLAGIVASGLAPGPEEGTAVSRAVLRLIRGGESVDVCSPLNGEVVVVNQSIVDSPGILPARPYGDGWLLAMRPTVSEDNLSGLMFGRIARGWQREEARRLGEMFQGGVATAADGATLARDALAGIPGVRWSKVLRKFLKLGMG